MIRSEMMERMSAQEFQTWQVYSALEPFGDRLVGSTLRNIHREKNAEAMMPFEYLTSFIPEKIQTPEQMHANFLKVFEFAKKKKAENGKPS